MLKHCIFEIKNACVEILRRIQWYCNKGHIFVKEIILSKDRSAQMENTRSIREKLNDTNWKTNTTPLLLMYLAWVFALQKEKKIFNHNLCSHGGSRKLHQTKSPTKVVKNNKFLLGFAEILNDCCLEKPPSYVCAHTHTIFKTFLLV